MTQLQTPMELACGLDDCEIMESTFASATAKGTPVVLGSGYVFLPFEAIETADVSGGDNPKTVACYSKAKKVLGAKADTVTFTAFAPVYYDVSEGTFTSTSTDNIHLGYTTKAAVAADESIEFNFDGNLPAVAALVAAAVAG